MIRRWWFRARHPSDMMRSVSRLLVALATAGIVALAIVGFVTKTQDANNAIRQRQDTANKAFSQVSDLLAKIDGLNGQIGRLEDQASQNAGRIAELQTEVTALVEQVRRMGGQPLVAAAPQNRPGTLPTTTTTVPPSPTPNGAPAPQQPPPTTNPSPARSPICATPLICIPGGKTP